MVPIPNPKGSLSATVQLAAPRFYDLGLGCCRVFVATIPIDRGSMRIGSLGFGAGLSVDRVHRSRLESSQIHFLDSNPPTKRQPGRTPASISRRTSFWLHDKFFATAGVPAIQLRQLPYGLSLKAAAYSSSRRLPRVTDAEPLALRSSLGKALAVGVHDLGRSTGEFGLELIGLIGTDLVGR